MNRLLGSILALFIILTSCSNKQNGVIVSADFDKEQWARFEYLSGDFDVVRAPVKHDLILEVTVSESFPNIYEGNKDEGVLSFNMTIVNPDGNGQRSRDYNFKLKDRDGNWKSENTGGYYHFKLPIINEMTFSEEGTYKFKIENKYHKDPLYGIKSLTLKYVN